MGLDPVTFPSMGATGGREGGGHMLKIHQKYKKNQGLGNFNFFFRSSRLLFS